MRLAGTLLFVTLLAAGCASDSPDADASGTAAETTEAAPQTTEAASETETSEGSDDGVASETELALSPGERAFGEVAVDGVTVEYIVLVPEGFRVGDTAPVLLALPPGSQDIGLATGTVRDIYQTEALARGWVVVSPAAPDGTLFFDGSERVIPGFLDFVESWVDPEGGAIHVSGISNGGISAFRVAGQNPERFRSLTVFPGFPRSDSDQAALENLSTIPVHLFVGERDAGWVAPMTDASDRLLGLGGDVTLEVFPDEGHIIGALSDGVRIFDELDAAR